MPKFLVQYKHIEETTYEQWIEANNEDEAIEKIQGEEDCERYVDTQGLEFTGHTVIREQD